MRLILFNLQQGIIHVFEFHHVNGRPNRDEGIDRIGALARGSGALKFMWTPVASLATVAASKVSQRLRWY